MKNYAPFLKDIPLFSGMSETEISTILPCLSAIYKSYEKGAYIFSADESVSFVGLILSGNVHIISEDFWGRKDIVSQLGPGELFAESFSCAGVDHTSVSAVAAENSEVLLIDCRKIIKTCSSACVFHTRLISNLLQILARKNIDMMRKASYLARRSTREKLLSYLSSEAQRAGKRSFDIPFNRQELADYLSVDRSAMSAELGKMRDDGLLDFDRSHFELKSEDGTL